MLRSSNNFLFGLKSIITMWVLGISLLSLASVLSSKNGFLWPMGQDIDWVLMLKQGIGPLAAEQEFSADHRNPLSGWFYSIASPLILNWDYGFHFLHLISSLILGLSVYALIWQFCSGRALAFPLAVGCVISVWWFWSNAGQVISLMLCVFSLSILTVASYCVYVDSGRTRGIFYGWSLSLWFLAIATYSIQCGAIIPIFLIAALRGQGKSINIKLALRDVLPYLLIGAGFMGIWIAAANAFFADAGVAETTHIHIAWKQLLSSVLYLIWHPSIVRLFHEASANYSIARGGLLALGFAGILYFMMRRTFKGKSAEGAFLYTGAAWTLLTALGLALPTLLLESTSSTFTPGTRSDMMYAAFIPMFVLSSVAFIGGILKIRSVNFLIFGTAAVLGGAVIYLNLEQNRQAVVLMKWQRNLIAGLVPLQQAVAKSLHFIVINESKLNPHGDDLADRFVQEKLNRVASRWSAQPDPLKASLRFVQSDPEPAGYSGSWRVVFEPHEVKGALYGSSLALPYDLVRVVRFNGEKVFLINDLKPSHLVGLQADLRRDKSAMVLG